MRNKFIVLQKGKKIFQFSMKPARKSALGDFDIMIQSNKKLSFDHVILGNYYEHYQSPEYNIKNISWHGYYEIINSKEVSPPVVHIKDEAEKVGIIRHLGSINFSEPFAFPVCSLYIPKNLPTNDIGLTEKCVDNIYLDVCDYEESQNMRIDFFVLPKSLPMDKFKKSDIMLQYRFADLGLFNIPSGEHNIVLDAEMNYFDHLKDNNIFIRVVNDTSNLDYLATDKKIYHTESDDFTLVINDPNDLYNKLTSYWIVEVEEDNTKNLTTLKKSHEETIQFKETDRLTIWD